MPNYFSIIIDKSVLQGLNKRESKWLFHHFRVNIPPVFFAELIGDLKKSDQRASTGNAVGDVRMLSGKIESSHVDLNATSASLLELELLGRKFPLDGRPVIESAQPVPMPDGSYGVLIDQTPMQRVLDRWRSGNFDEMERDFAEIWRKRIATIDLEAIVKATKGQAFRDAASLSDVAGIVDSYCFRPGCDYANLLKWMKINSVPEPLTATAIRRWRQLGRPPATNFAPYTAHLAKVELFFYVAVSCGLISTRSSNEIDCEYFRYIPFARVFSSSDKLHRKLFDAFSSDKQMFVYGPDLKEGLTELAEHYKDLSPSDLAKGSFNYADYPPVEMNNAITQAYDRVMPDWRERAKEPKPPRDPADDARTLERLKPIIEALKKHSDQG